MSSKLWGDPATVCRSRSSEICWPPRRAVLVIGKLLRLATVLTVFGAPAKAAIGTGALGLRTQASQIAPVEQVQLTNGRKKYNWHANGWNGPGYYEAGDAWKTGVGGGNNNAGAQPPPPQISGNNNLQNNNSTGVHDNIVILDPSNNSPAPNNNSDNNNSRGLHEYRAKIPGAGGNPNFIGKPLILNQLRTVSVPPLHLR
jgi:hypothetical protein